MVGGFFEQTVADAYELYEREMHRMNAMDFDDLLVRTVNVLELFPEVRARYGATFRHVLVDEYQDTNHAQYRLLQLLAGEEDGHRNLAVVGDDAQSVYGFRGADIRNILDFQDDFADATRRQARAELPLDADASSTPPTRSSPTTAGRWPSTCGRSSARATSSRSASSTTSTPRRGSSWGRSSGSSTRASRAPRSPCFYRTNAQSRVLEDTLDAARDRLPGHRRHEVLRARRDQGRDRLPDGHRQPAGRRLVHARRQLAAARHRADVAVAGHRPRRDDGDQRLGRRGRCRAASPAWAPPPSRRSGASWRRWTACASARTPASRSATCSRPSCTSPATSTRWRPSGRSRPRGARRTWRRSSRPPASSTPRMTWTATARTRLDVFLQQIALVADADSRRDDEGLVTLMTLHNAKGLEYPIVFIIGCEEGVFPHSRSIDEGSLEEERRLCYVGVTRAMRDLYLTYARRRAVFGGAPSYGLPSRFLAEIPTDLVDREGSVASASSWAAASAAAGRSARGRRPGRGGGSDAGGGTTFRLGEDVVHAAFGDGVVDRRRARRHRRRPLRLRRHGAQAHGRVRADHQARLTVGGDDHRRQGGRRAAARGGRRRRGGVHARARAGRPAWRPSSSATTRPARSTSAGKQQACAEVGHPGLRPPPAGGRAARGGPRADRRAQRRPATSSGILCQLPVPDHLDGVELTDRDRRRQGRRRPDDRVAPGGSRSACRACGPARRSGVMRAARREAGRRARRAPRPWSSGARTCSASRWPSSCSPPTPRSRSATRAPATSPRSARRADVLIAAVGRPAPREGRLGQARRGRHRRRHEPRRERARRRRRLRRGPPRSPRRSRRSPAASGR